MDLGMRYLAIVRCSYLTLRALDGAANGTAAVERQAVVAAEGDL